MNSDTIEGNWKQLMGDIQEKWGRITDDHLIQVDGSRKKLAGIIQENYGIAREEAERQIADWEESRDMKTNHPERAQNDYTKQ